MGGVAASYLRRSAPAFWPVARVPFLCEPAGFGPSSERLTPLQDAGAPPTPAPNCARKGEGEGERDRENNLYLSLSLSLPLCSSLSLSPSPSPFRAQFGAGVGGAPASCNGVSPSEEGPEPAGSHRNGTLAAGQKAGALRRKCDAATPPKGLPQRLPPSANAAGG